MAKAKAKTKAATGKTKQQLAEELDILRHQLSVAEDKASLSESIISIASDAIISIDENQSIIRFNQGAEQIFGYSARELVGQSLEILLPDEFRHGHQKHVSEFGQSTVSSRMMNERRDIVALRKDGSQFPARASISRLEHDGALIYTVFLRDLSEFKAIEIVAQKSRDELAHVSRVGMLGEISASIAHEVNQPLAAIFTNAQVLQRYADSASMGTEDFSETIADVISDALRAGEVIKRLRSLMRPGESKVEMFDMNQLIVSTLQLLHSEAVIKHITVGKDLLPGVLNVVADKVQMQQILLNLITNAFDAMAECVPEDRHLNICTSSLGNDTVEVLVKDTGHGFEEKLFQQLFEPFYTTKEGGMGMGLAISKTMLLAQGGRLWAKNNQGSGACFSFTLPTKSQPEKAIESGQPVVDGSSDKHIERLTIDATVFVVDDDDSFRTAVCRLIRSLGYAVEGFPSVEQYLQHDAYEGVGCLLVDLHMPGETGFDLQAALKKHKYSMPIIFITGAGDTASGVQAMKDGALDFLAKPVDEHKLKDILVHAVKVDRQARIKFTQQMEANAKLSRLTNREVQVMGLVIKGLRNKQIAFTLGISEKTVKVHRGHLMTKVSANSVADLLRLSEMATQGQVL
jgi:PAS domain S-box-containing protein